MSDEADSAVAPDEVRARTAQLFDEMRQRNYARTDRMFAGVLLVQWAVAIVLAVLVSPYAWEGHVRTVHAHVLVAVVLGGLITSLPVVLALRRPGWVVTRNVIACAQMLWSALLIHLTGGRIETHFHVFGSLAFVAFYRDWRVLVPATAVVVADHLLRGLYWPESVYGVLRPESWRFLEHAGWLVFEDVVLVLSCLRGTAEMQHLALRQAQTERLSERERAKSVALDAALTAVNESQQALVRSEKLAAVGQLAASVGHELRNPLAAVRNAAAYIAKKLGDPKAPAPTDPRVQQFLGVIDRELTVSARIISDLLDFARERTPVLRPCPLHPLVAEALAVLPPSSVRVVNAVPESLPVPELDKDQFRQVLINLVQNAVEAIPPERDGEVSVSADGGGDRGLTIWITDNGQGMPPDVVAKIFEPLFTTKTKGTGLGLAVVANLVRGHRGTIRVESEPARGTRFVIELPPGAAQQAA